MSAINQYLQRDAQRDLLRFITCGSVDDGKSTLIGRLLYDSQLILDDQLDRLAKDSAQHGTQGQNLDYALLVDGLEAEREQGITIDVAYRFFGTQSRKFIVADCPGHEQYTRNMATGASTADLAVVLVDARKGLLTQTRRHSYIAALMGIRHVILAVNKMDLVEYDQDAFDRIAQEYDQLAAQFGIEHVMAIPLSALRGDNVTARSAQMDWHQGPTLIEHLNAVNVSRSQDNDIGFRMPVQLVVRPDADFRGFAGTVLGGDVSSGDAVVVLPGGKRTHIGQILSPAGEITKAEQGQPVTLTFTDDIDITRGDVIAKPDNAPEVADQFAAQLLWMGDSPLLPGRRYWFKLGSRTVNAQITDIKYKIDVNTQEHLAAKDLELNEVAQVNLHLDQPIAFEPYRAHRELGGFILMDRQTNATVGAGMIEFALRRAANIHWQPVDIDARARAAIKHQTPRCIWLTGLSGAGKSTIANLVEQQLHDLGLHTYILDGDNVRHGLNKDLGFTDQDRVENIRRVAEVAHLMVDAGLIVIVSFISPFRAERQMARDLFGPDQFKEVFVDTPLQVAEQRDVKGLYAKARKGELANFTGISSPYEPPQHADLVLDTQAHTAQELAARVADLCLKP